MFRLGYCSGMGQKEQAARAVNLRAQALIQAAFDEAAQSSGMTQQQLADDSGIPRSTLANILSRTAEPRLIHVEQLVRVALAVGADSRAWIRELEALAKADREQSATGGASVTPIRAPRKPAPQVQKRAARKHTDGK